MVCHHIYPEKIKSHLQGEANQTTTTSFITLDYIWFSTNPTRAALSNKLEYKFNHTIVGHHFYFSRMTRLSNLMSQVNLEESFQPQLLKFFTAHFINKSGYVYSYHNAVTTKKNFSATTIVF